LFGVGFALGIAFVALSIVDYRIELRELLPTEDSYGSIFYTIVTFHMAHLLLGLGMMGWVLLQPRLKTTKRRRPLTRRGSACWGFACAPSRRSSSSPGRNASASARTSRHS
jgi:heme/copper-type cytochrome/quinol oxidase subunit 3